LCDFVIDYCRTFCYLEDVKALEDGSQVKGPLIVIKETEFSRDSSDNMDTDEDSTHAVCEYGVTIIDALTATVTLGQFADDVLRTRMQTLLASFDPTEVIVEGGENGASKTLLGLIKTACPRTSIGTIGPNDNFPKSFAVEDEARIAMVRPRQKIHPWSVKECIDELHRKGYYPRSSKNGAENGGATGRWPEVLRACIEGEADLVLSSFGAALFYLQSNLVDDEILSMGLVKAYIPPNSGSSAKETSRSQTPEQLQNIYQQEARRDAGVELDHANDSGYSAEEATIDHMALDGTTLANLEILHNLSSGSYKGSLLSKIDFTKSPHGSRLLKAWLLRPLFIKAEIDRRADAVAELSTGAAAMAMREVRDLLKRTGDIERLLSRVHSMGGGGNRSGASHHPDERAIFYENEKHNKRKVEDFSKLLNGLKSAAGIPEKFDGVHIDSPLVSDMLSLFYSYLIIALALIMACLYIA
jgi:DNA mismatch repair protein MSH6